ncbi:MAG: hypothetical protein JWO80_2817 [Bryobacterales bacterium]|nr:hypothetical protein [Bryobacterales bacterium]
MVGLSAGLKGILRLQWLAYWRRVSRGGSAAKNNLVVLGLIAVGISARYVTILKSVIAQARKGQFFELDLLAAAVFALCLSPMWETGNTGMGPRELARFPLTARERLIAEIWGGLVSPVCWIGALFCLTILLPLGASPHPICAVIAGLAFLLASFMSGFGVRNFLRTSSGQKFGRAALGVFLAAGAVLWLQMGRGSAVALNFLPSHLVVAAASGSWVACGMLAVLAVAATLLGRYSLIWMLEREPAAVSRNAVSAVGMTLLRKDLRYFRRMEPVVWLILLALAFYLATAKTPEPDAVRAVLAFTSVLTVASAMNCFGPDGPDGLDRYGLWPLRGSEIVGTKNRALALLAAARWVPVLALAGWRFGWIEGMYDSVEALSLLLGSMAWGNVTSVRHPYVGEETSSIIDQVIGLAASGLPGAFTIGILRGPAGSVPYAMAGMLAVCGVAYAASLRWAGNYYARGFDAMRERLS